MYVDSYRTPRHERSKAEEKINRDDGRTEIKMQESTRNPFRVHGNCIGQPQDGSRTISTTNQLDALKTNQVPVKLNFNSEKRAIKRGSEQAINSRSNLVQLSTLHTKIR